MIPIIVGMVAVTLALLAWMYRPRGAERRVVYRTEPDRPQPFGEGMTWIALGTTRTDAVLKSFRFAKAKPANWASGVATIYDPALGTGRVYISPPVNGWTLVAGQGLTPPKSASVQDDSANLLRRLSRDFGTAQMFSAEATEGCFGWATAEDGEIARLSYAADGAFVTDDGARDRDEAALRKDLFELDGMYDRRGDFGSGLIFLPTSAFIFAIAGCWSLDPTRLGARSVAMIKRPGYVARITDAAVEPNTRVSRRAA
ncbi:MAG: hypothetical protein AAFU50_04000 [Pseudomonadota bacterium]